MERNKDALAISRFLATWTKTRIQFPEHFLKHVLTEWAPVGKMASVARGGCRYCTPRFTSLLANNYRGWFLIFVVLIVGVYLKDSPRDLRVWG